MIVSCPRCGSANNCHGMPVGTPIACNACGWRMAVPSELMTPPMQQVAIAEPPHAPTSIVLNTAPRPLPRLKAHNWFANAYGTTMGIVLALLTIPLVTCTGLLVIGAVNQPTPQPQKTVVRKTVASRVTLANYHRIRTGMSREKVFAILGAGQQVSHVSSGGTTVESYLWDAHNDGACTIVFENGAVLSKVQFGLP